MKQRDSEALMRLVILVFFLAVALVGINFHPGWAAASDLEKALGLLGAVVAGYRLALLVCPRR
ncbi:hypothetical protein [Rubrivivax gelatinosus]|uniref:hypothetical protein n=1 Tax=Rubrivivax gelatinosus TaxID=28068 RepID=UPI0012FDE40F|nr:hypothetical protein [Rubrivivax gelatinosus]MBG6083175.1 hypothetical protein [Rubrivivax gelatinosus]